MLGVIQLLGGLGYLTIVVYMGAYQTGYHLWDYPTFQIAAGVAVVLIASQAIAYHVPFSTYIVVYLVAISPFFLLLLYIIALDSSGGEYWALFAVSLMGALSTGIFFERFLHTKRALPWLSWLSAHAKVKRHR
jgi:hypothetical protein